MATIRAKIVLYPKSGNEGYCTDKLLIVEKSTNWTYSTSDYIEDGYVMTNAGDSISDINANYWIRFKAISGYNIVSCYKTNSGDTSNRGEFAIDSDCSVTVYPWESGTATIVNNYLHFIVEEDTDNEHDVDEYLTNCTSDAESRYNSGDNVTITLTCDAGYKFDDVPYARMNDTSYSFTVSSDRTTAILNITVVADVEIFGESVRYYAMNLNLEHCTSNITDEIKQGMNTIILTCDAGYSFDGHVTIYDNGTHLTDVTSDFENANTRCTIVHNVKGDLTVTATATKQSEKLSAFANLYRVTNNVLEELSKVRFYDLSGDTAQSFDYGQYITALYIIPFNLDDTMIADTAKIKLGDYDSGVSAESLETYVFHASMGSISVPEKYKNAYDYISTVCTLHLPYCEPMQIETHYVINHSITIDYKIYLYSGECTVNVTSNITGEVIASKSFQLGTQIPFMQVQTGGIMNQLKQVLNNDITTPYMEITRNIPYNINTMFGRETVDYGKLENYSGFIKVSDILLNINAKNDEKEEIISLLKNGVYINEKTL